MAAGTAKSGKLVLLKLGTTEAAVSIMSAKTNSLSINHTVVDTTTKKENGWGSILSGGGVTEMTIALDGVYLGETYDKTIRGYGMDGTSNGYTIVDGFGDKWVGNFVITKYDIGGDQQAAETFSISLRNDGEIVYTPAT